MYFNFGLENIVIYSMLEYVYVNESLSTAKRARRF